MNDEWVTFFFDISKKGTLVSCIYVRDVRIAGCLIV